jgi:hypothetical protein
MLHVSTAHLSCHPQGYVLHDAGEGPTHPRNARDMTALTRTLAPSRSPARNISDRPSSSRSSGSSYYQRPSAGSGNWSAPRPPTRLPEPQCMSLIPPTGYLPGGPGLISAEHETKLFARPSYCLVFSPIATGPTTWRSCSSLRYRPSSAPRLYLVCH